MTGILVERAMEMGYLTEGGTVYVAASGGSERWKAKRADAIRTGLDTLLRWYAGGSTCGKHRKGQPPRSRPPS